MYDAVKTGRVLLSSAEAAAALGVRRETLYAYVSRGQLERHRRPGDRGSWFDPAEVDRLAGRGRARGDLRPEREVRIESAITSIEGGAWFYRGRDPVELARDATFERVAEFLWTGRLPESARWLPDPRAARIGMRVQSVLRPDTPPAERLRLVTAAIAANDPFRNDLGAPAVTATARRLIATLIECLPRAGRGAGAARAAARGVAASLWTRVAARPAAARELALLDGALVILADHELAASTFAVRIAAALRADPYGAIGAGLGVLGGALHGAVSVAAEALLREIASSGSVGAVIERHVRRGERLPGIGHPLYPEGDPRGRVLLGLLRAAGGDRRRLRQVDSLLETIEARGLPAPNVDLGLAAIVHVLGLAPGTGELVFALARMAGWIAHALEEYVHPSTIRPRAVYTGERPGRIEP